MSLVQLVGGLSIVCFPPHFKFQQGAEMCQVEDVGSPFQHLESPVGLTSYEPCPHDTLSCVSNSGSSTNVITEIEFVN